MEDGYEVDISRPTSIYHPVNNPSGTQIWGDGDPTNGFAPGFPDDIIPSGTTIILENELNGGDAPDPANPKFRAGDRIGVTKVAAIATTVWATGSTTLLSDAVEVYDVFNWGSDFVLPFGTDVPNHNQTFEIVDASIMAGRGGATVTVNGSSSFTLAEGETEYLTELRLGDNIVSDNPIQVDVLTGDRNSNFESRWFPLIPRDRWESSYHTPVSTPNTSYVVDMSDGPDAGFRTAVWLYNPNSSPITVTYERRGGNNPVVNASNGDTTKTTATAMSGSHYGNVYGPIHVLDSNGNATNPPEGDWIGVVKRSGTALLTQIANAQSAGAAAVIVVNNSGTTAPPTGSVGSNRIIPVIGVGQTEGDAIISSPGYGWVRVSGDTTASTTTVSARSVTRVFMEHGYAGHFHTDDERVFYAYSTTDVGSGNASQNQTWDWGYAMVPEHFLTRQILVSFGFGRDPISDIRPNENGLPVWISTVGNGDRDVTVYVDFDADPATGYLTDPYGNKYDLALTLRELESVKVYNPHNPSTGQSGMLAYVLDSDVRLAAAWGQDVMRSSVGEPGFDAGTGIPPQPLFTARKTVKLLNDNDDDGHISPGDDLEYEIVIENISRVPLSEMTLEDLLPEAVEYFADSTIFVDHENTSRHIADHEHDDYDGFPFHVHPSLFEESGLVPGVSCLPEDRGASATRCASRTSTISPTG